MIATFPVAALVAVQVAAQVAAALPQAAATARIPDGVGVHVAAAVVPDTVYVGQQALYQVAVFVSDEVRSRLRRNPEFVPPELRGLLAYDPPGGYRLYQGVVRDGRRWEVHVFQRAVFPLGAGALRIPEARLSYALPTSSSFFAREETVALQAAAVTLVAVDPPSAGRPPAWGGAVGDLSLEATLDGARVRVGDPLTLSVRVRGTGNVNLFPRPAVTLPWGDVVAGGDEVRLDSVPLLVRGEKRFDWIVTPRRAGRLVVPPIRLSYWEPQSGAWRTAETSPLTLEAVAGAAGAVASGAPVDGRPDSAATDTVPRLRSEWRGEAPPPVHRRWAFWLLALLAPVPALGALRRGRTRDAADATDAASRRAPAVARRATTSPAAGDRGAATPVAALAAWRGALAGHVDLPVGAAEPMVAQALRRAGVTDATARRAAAFDAALQQAAYGGRPAPRDTEADVLAAVRREMRGGAVTRGGNAGPRRGARRAWWRLGRVLAVSTVGLAAVSPATAQSAAPDSAATRYAAGVAAWTAGLTGDALRAFADAAALAPRSARAWEALGTAAFAEADTAVAIMAWQRAARLAPYDRRVRDRLRPFLDTSRPVWSPAFLPPYDASGWALAGLAAWLVGWGVAAWRLRGPRGGGRPTWRGPAVAGAVIALACAAGAAWTEHQLAGRDLVVARRDVRLRAVPALAADPVAAVQVGEVVRVLEQRDGWRRVRLADARDGWLEDADVLGIARPE